MWSSSLSALYDLVFLLIRMLLIRMLVGTISGHDAPSCGLFFFAIAPVRFKQMRCLFFFCACRLTIAAADRWRWVLTFFFSFCGHVPNWFMVMKNCCTGL